MIKLCITSSRFSSLLLLASTALRQSGQDPVLHETAKFELTKKGKQIVVEG